MQNADDSSSGPEDRDEPGIDPTEATFEEWIEHVAAAETVPPEEVRARLMSSYWILDELAWHLDNASFEELPDDLATEELSGTGSGEGTDRVRTILEELLADARSMEPRAPADPEQPTWERLVEVVESLDGFDDPVTARRRAGEPQAPEQDPEALALALNELQEQVGAEQAPESRSGNKKPATGDDSDRSVDGAELDAMAAGMTERLSELESSLEVMEAEVGRLDARLGEQAEGVTDIDRQLDAQTERLQQLGDTLTALAEKLQALEGDVGTNRDRLEAVESTIDEHANHFEELQHSVSEHEVELKNAAKVLRYLFSEMEDLEARTGDIAPLLRDLEPLVDAHLEQTRLDSLKQTAAELDVRTAECESCESMVDLGLLTDPACPHCGTPAAQVVHRSGFLRSKTVLESADPGEEPPRPEWTTALEDHDHDSRD